VRAHNWHALGWLIWAVVSIGFFAIWEMIGLASRTDDKQPLTYYIRKMVGTPNNPFWWILAAILVWMLAHFLFYHNT
jgi:predicted MFS family arabinose efflux permease